MAHVEQILVYPVKSCRGIAVPRARLLRGGLEHDRAFALVGDDGRALSQKKLPRLALLAARVEGSELTLEAEGMGRLGVALDDPNVGRRALFVLDVPTTGRQYLDPEPGRRLSDFLGVRCVLVRRDDAPAVRAARRGVPGAINETRFADSDPLSVLSTASLSDLNARLTAPVGFERFRPNLVLGGMGPFEEDRAAALAIGGVQFLGGVKVERCVMIQIDPATAEIEPEPGRTLARYRVEGGSIVFARFFHHAGEGEIAVGMEVAVEFA